MEELIVGLLFVGTVVAACAAAIGGLVWAVSRSRRASWVGASVVALGLAGWFVVSVLRHGFAYY